MKLNHTYGRPGKTILSLLESTGMILYLYVVISAGSIGMMSGSIVFSSNG